MAYNTPEPQFIRPTFEANRNNHLTAAEMETAVALLEQIANQHRKDRGMAGDIQTLRDAIEIAKNQTTDG